jgi:hypothetical protein
MADQALAQLFRDRAAELRQIAGTLKDVPLRAQILRMAIMYEALALKLDSDARSP